MLITDGAVEDYEAVFEKYNWPDRKVCLGSDKREGRGKVLFCVVGVEEHKPGYQAKLSIHVVQHLNLHGHLTVNASTAARQEPAVVISEVRGLQMRISRSGKLFFFINCFIKVWAIKIFSC